MVATAQTRYRRTSFAHTVENERPLVRSSHRLNALAGVAALLLIATVLGLSLYAFGHQGRIYQGVSIAGVDVSGMTEAEATEALQQDYSIYMNTPLMLTFEGKSYAITPSDLGMRLDEQASVEAAMRYGREGSLWDRSRAWAKGLFTGSDVSAVVIADSSRVDQGLLALTDVVARPATNAWIDFSADEPVVVPEIPGVGYDYGQTRAQVTDRIQNRSTTPVQIATTTVQPEITAQTLASTLPSAQSALANAFVVRGLDGQAWTIDAQQLKSIVSINSDGTALTVDRDAVERMVAGIADAIDSDSRDAALYVSEAGTIELSPAANSVEVDAKASAKQIEQSLLAGNHDVSLTIERNPPAITDARATEAMSQVTATLAKGITVKWDGGEKLLTSADLMAGLVIQPTPDEKDPFAFSLSADLLTSYIQTFAGDIEVEPHEPVFRLVNGEVEAEKKGRTGVVIDYESSAKRIEKAVFSGYASSNLKVDVIKPKFSTADAASISLPDVLGEGQSGPKRRLKDGRRDLANSATHYRSSNDGAGIIGIRNDPKSYFEAIVFCDRSNVFDV